MPISKTFQHLSLAFLVSILLVHWINTSYNFNFSFKHLFGTHLSRMRLLLSRNASMLSAKVSSSKTTYPTCTTSQLSTPAMANRKKNLYMVCLGRFGNVIFEFAAAYSMKLGANCDKLFFQDNGQSNRLRLFFPKLNGLLKNVPRPPPGLTVVSEIAQNKCNKKTYEQVLAATKDVRIQGYFGVPSYWWPKYEKEVKEILAVSEDFQTRARIYLFQIASLQNVSLEVRKGTLKSGISPKLADDVPVLVGIHVRRGDKVFAKNTGPGWNAPDKSYFQNATNYYRSKFKTVYFIVVSQDKNWGRQNIVGKDVIYSTSNDDLLEFALLTLCDHFIISLGTFGWWAGYLTGGEVVYFLHHVLPNSPVAKIFNNDQYFLPSWKPLL